MGDVQIPKLPKLSGASNAPARTSSVRQRIQALEKLAKPPNSNFQRSASCAPSISIIPIPDTQPTPAHERSLSTPALTHRTSIASRAARRQARYSKAERDLSHLFKTCEAQPAASARELQIRMLNQAKESLKAQADDAKERLEGLRMQLAMKTGDGAGGNEMVEERVKERWLGEQRVKTVDENVDEVQRTLRILEGSTTVSSLPPRSLSKASARPLGRTVIKQTRPTTMSQEEAKKQANLARFLSSSHTRTTRRSSVRPSSHVPLGHAASLSLLGSSSHVPVLKDTQGHSRRRTLQDVSPLRLRPDSLLTSPTPRHLRFHQQSLSFTSHQLNGDLNHSSDPENGQQHSSIPNANNTVRHHNAASTRLSHRLPLPPLAIVQEDSDGHAPRHVLSPRTPSLVDTQPRLGSGSDSSSTCSSSPSTPSPSLPDVTAVKPEVNSPSTPPASPSLLPSTRTFTRSPSILAHSRSTHTFLTPPPLARVRKSTSDAYLSSFFDMANDDLGSGDIGMATIHLPSSSSSSSSSRQAPLPGSPPRNTNGHVRTKSQIIATLPTHTSVVDFRSSLANAFISPGGEELDLSLGVRAPEEVRHRASRKGAVLSDDGHGQGHGRAWKSISKFGSPSSSRRAATSPRSSEGRMDLPDRKSVV